MTPEYAREIAEPWGEKIYFTLTDKQFELFQKICQGWTVDELAEHPDVRHSMKKMLKRIEWRLTKPEEWFKGRGR